MPKSLDTPEYWLESFTPTSQELDHVYERVFEAGRPVKLEALARELIRYHVDRVTQAHRAAATGGAVYRPAERYSVGQKVVFPALEGAAGKVERVRPGNNPHYGEYEVIRVKLSDGYREFAAGLQMEHVLNQQLGDIDAEDIAARFADLVSHQLRETLVADSEWVCQGDRWVIRVLLPEINMGHRNLAEAVLLLSGKPLAASQILPELGVDESIPLETWSMALDRALASDERFKNVGPAEAPLWALRAAP